MAVILETLLETKRIRVGAPTGFVASLLKLVDVEFVGVVGAPGGPAACAVVEIHVRPGLGRGQPIPHENQHHTAFMNQPGITVTVTGPERILLCELARKGCRRWPRAITQRSRTSVCRTSVCRIL